MGKIELKKRKNWQTHGQELADKAEQNLYEAFDEEFKGTNYRLLKKPNHLRKLYNRIYLNESVREEIFNPNIDLDSVQWGVAPDFAIENLKTGKILFGEIKRQDGWVEGKEPSAGRGNAHERMCKLFTPGLLKAYREIGKIIDEKILPFWVVFEGDITRDPKRVREIVFWFDKYDKNYYMWRPNQDSKGLIQHFNMYLKKYLD